MAVIAPTAPAENAIAFMVEMRSAGYHSTNAVREAIRHAETPTPMSARAAIAAAALSACANHAPCRVMVAAARAAA